MKVYILALAVVSRVAGHSWLDCIGRAETKYAGFDQFFTPDFYDKYCIGYPRAYPGRMNRDINTLFTYSVLDRIPTTNVCPTQEKAYSRQFPMAKVKAGETIKLWYEMDNHLSPETQVHLWSYGIPGKDLVKYSEQTEKTHVFQHTFATSANCFDTHNVNTFCWAYWQVPSDWKTGNYSFVWNWRWDRNANGEEYNSCFDLDVTGNDLSYVTPTLPPTPTPISPSPTSHARKCRAKTPLT
ncbi:hypothetical protein DSO57_1010696 [Entomophthora muscae]|uniref:Uncharacterized protein n=1 Tax=Entomophthora muscae TaxID=34485 RepID=A0ACC2T6V8_9FUNG|nr:hypothetical protein DSO57_1010696 [Entomophthora muscae]